MDSLLFLEDIIIPGLSGLERLSRGAILNSTVAQRFMLAVSLQESGPKLEARYQRYPSLTPGPARGWWQFEQGGGVYGVLNHHATSSIARTICKEFSVDTNVAAVWRTLEGHDLLSTMFARLLIYSDPEPIPTNAEAGWDYYLRTWRPGAPHEITWHPNWSTASETVGISV